MSSFISFMCCYEILINGMSCFHIELVSTFLVCLFYGVANCKLNYICAEIHVIVAAEFLEYRVHVKTKE